MEYGQRSRIHYVLELSMKSALIVAFVLFASATLADAAEKNSSFTTWPVGVVYQASYRELGTMVLETLRNDFKVGTQVIIVEVDWNVNRKQRILTASIGSTPARSDAFRVFIGDDNPDEIYTYKLKMDSAKEKEFRYFGDGVVIGVVGDSIRISYDKGKVITDIDNDGIPERFFLCMGTESFQLTVWSGKRSRETKRWGAAFRLDNSTIQSCKENEGYR